MNYSLLIMETAGMMNMATGDGFPLRQGAETGSRLVFGGYRGLCWRNSRSRFLFEGFCIYKNFWRQFQVRGVHEEPTRSEGVPSTLVVASGLFWPTSGTPWASSGLKMISVKFQLNWTPFGFPFLRYSKTRKKTETGTRL